MDLRATLAAVAEFLPVEGVPEMVVYDNLFEEVDLGTIDEPLRQLLLARRGSYEVTVEGTIVRRLGRFSIRLTPCGGVVWVEGDIVCRGGDLPAVVRPLLRVWLSRPSVGARTHEYLGAGTSLPRPNGLPNVVSGDSLQWEDGDAPFSARRVAYLQTREVMISGHGVRRMTDEEFDAYSRMHRECMTSRTE